MSIYDRFEKHADKTFADAAARYLEEFQGKDPMRCKLGIESVMPYIGTLRLIDVDDETMQQYKHDRFHGTGHFDRPAMAGTVNKEITLVVTILNKACRVWRWLPSAPKIVHVKGKARKGYPLSFEEQARLFWHLSDVEDVRAALFAINTGVRKSELYGLKWSDMVEIPELDTFVFILRDTKNGQDRPVICNSIARRVIEQRREFGDPESEYVFPARECNQSGKMWIAAWKAAGLPQDPLIRKGIHNTRHTFAHRLRAAGVPEEDRDSLLGHNKHNISQHYALPDLKRLVAAAELVTEIRETTVLR